MKIWIVSCTFIVAGSMAAPSAASAFCSAPTAPTMYETKPSPPREPFCVNKIMNTHTCSNWEINSYNDDVDKYNRDLERYKRASDLFIDQLNAYLTAARRFAECEVRNL